MTATGANESVTFDLGAARPISHFVLDVYSHFDKRSVRAYRFDVSNDDRTYRTVLQGANPDSAGSSYKYELPAIVTARYIRFALVDTFCDSYAPRTNCGPYFVLSDLRAGLLQAASGGAASTEPTPTPAPHVSESGNVEGAVSMPSAAAAAAPPPSRAVGRQADGVSASPKPKIAGASALSIARVGGHVGRDGRVRLELLCKETSSRSCRGQMTLNAVGLPVRKAHRVAARAELDLAGRREAQAVAVRLSEAVLRHLRSRGSMRLRVDVTNGTALTATRTVAVRWKRARPR
jgi:hypothetical protein